MPAVTSSPKVGILGLNGGIAGPMLTTPRANPMFVGAPKNAVPDTASVPEKGLSPSSEVSIYLLNWLVLTEA